MNTDWPQTAELPANYLEVILPELLSTGALDNNTHRQVLDVLGDKGFQSAINALWILLTISTLRGTL